MDNERTIIGCVTGCAACCVAPSISSPIPGMPGGKPAGMRCVQLDEQNRCRLFGKPERPEVCVAFQATAELCGQGAKQAMELLAELELQTR